MKEAQHEVKKTMQKKRRKVQLPDGKLAIEEQLVIRGLDTQILYSYWPIGSKELITKLEYNTDAWGKIVGCVEIE